MTQSVRLGKTRRYCKRTYKKLNVKELEEHRSKNMIKIKVENNKIDTGTKLNVEKVIESDDILINSCYKKAGNEGKKHSDKKMEIGLSLFNKFKDKFIDIETDGVWLEYPLISLDNKTKFSNYNQKKLNYLLSLFQPIVNKEEIVIKNLTIDDGNYSPVAYDISIATQNNIVYPPKDPAIFEVKYMDSDIKGLVV